MKLVSFLHMLRARRYVTLVTSVPVATSLPFSSARISPFLILRPSKSLSRAAKVTRPVATLSGRLHHVGGVFVLGGVRVKVEHGGDALGNGAGGKHDDSAVRNALGLLGGHDDVFVVGQHEHRLGGHALHSGHDIGSVEGFMVCPPDTTASAPRSVKMALRPSPAATATKPNARSWSTAA